MALTAEEYQDEIAADLGQKDNLDLVSKVATWWSMNEAFGYNLHLRYLKTLKKAIVFLMGNNWQKFDHGEGDTYKKESQRMAMLEKLLVITEDQIKEAENGMTSGMTVGQILVMQPSDPTLPFSYIGRGTEPDPVLTELNPYGRDS